MSLSWQTVSVFVSSTFNDMHAERDYLVKRVFPELREWCEQRELRLIDIDLRWGITEADATNKNVVKVCLNRIDEYRPFSFVFLINVVDGFLEKMHDLQRSSTQYCKH